MTRAPFRFTILDPAAAMITLPPPLPLPAPPYLGLLTLMRSDGGRRTARGWAALAGLRLSVTEAQLRLLDSAGIATCSAQLWEAV